MDIQMIALLLAFGVVSCIAILALRQNRYYARKLNQLKKEPILNGQPAETATATINEQATASALITIAEELVIASPTAEIRKNLQAITKESPVTTSSSSSVRPTFNVTPRDFIVLTLLAKPERPYTGYELLQALLASGLRFGKMNVFHRYEKISGQGEVLFSLASAVEPGIFELNKMGSFSCPGLTLFLQLSDLQKANKDLLQAFDLMLETAHQLADDLGGEVCDEQRQLLTEEKISDWRSYLAYYERSHQIPDLFA